MAASSGYPALAELQGSDFLSSADITADQTRQLLRLAADLKAERTTIHLGGRCLGLIFSKASTRTRVSFTVAMARLGGQTIDLNPQVSQVGRGEPVADTARVLSRYVDALAIRTFAQEELAEYAHWASIPVINALTDLEHPCQALADYLTLQEAFNDLPGLTMAYVGDGNNVAHSLMLCGALLGVNVRIGCPRGFEPSAAVLEQARKLAAGHCQIEVLHDPVATVRGAHGLYTDVWASMGQEQEQSTREEAFAGWCLSEDLVAEADGRAIVLHCLPAHRGEEISAGAMEGSSSRVFDQAENRLHAQQALLAALLAN
ncbi:ornithine carbamoyltransferase [Cyanobium sp. HWJ4-Hawea]|uniref:ornithine carbamoyltransferase n=1 Tax=Cyanobium sp. HWJ4-Hawea TaxID=2823713 RepID=UPI0020CD45CD|nr:ornithine carbamoyltransferase [Cyanobium sp. HWJ4-Hawea]MCP9808027.1 ornithine carbamoyltransferase [Cyanobium sp. HWJ4-Hawea]